VESPYPGYLLSQDTFHVGRIKGVGRIWRQAVVDTYGSFAFGKLHTSKLPETAVDVLYDRVLPFYESQGLQVEHILMDNGREYCGRAMIHPYQIFLDFNDIEHRRTKVARPRTNGFVERFNRTVLDEFLRETFREKFYISVEELQEDLDRWLHSYNYERPHRGYRNMGRRPIETIEAGKVIKEQEALKQAA
jgi:transposase InsO family protein